MTQATCNGCDNGWPRVTNRAHCSMCHITFYSVREFDMHLKACHTEHDKERCESEDVE